MSQAKLVIVELARGTRFGEAVRRFAVRIGGRKLAEIVVKTAPLAAKDALHELTKNMKLITSAVISLVLEEQREFYRRFPNVLKGIQPGTFADMVGDAMGRGKRSFEALRGLIIEKMVRDLPQAAKLLEHMEEIVLAEAKRTGRKWSKPRWANGIRDLNGREWGDLVLVSTSGDEVWIVAIIESKSFTNVKELAEQEGKQVGQHVWDWVRAKTIGLEVEGKTFARGKVHCEPVPPNKWMATSKDAVVGAKDLATRKAQMQGGRYTQFIGFAPKELSDGQILAVSGQGVQIEMWGQWPFNLTEYKRFHTALVAALEKLKL